jgi:hypothetical protein
VVADSREIYGLGAPEYQGGTDPLIADKWKEDVNIILRIIRVDGV